MKKLWNTFVWIIDGLTAITGGMGALAILAAALIVTEGVIVRKVFGVSTIWQIEASVFLLIFACFVGAPFGQKHEHHLNVDLIIFYLPPKIREITLIVTSILAWITCGIIAWHAWPMWWEAVTRNDHSESLWGPPLWIPYSFLPLGLSLLFFQYIVHIVKKIIALKKKEVAEEVTRTELKDIEIPVSHTDQDN